MRSFDQLLSLQPAAAAGRSEKDVYARDEASAKSAAALDAARAEEDEVRLLERGFMSELADLVVKRIQVVE